MDYGKKVKIMWMKSCWIRESGREREKENHLWLTFPALQKSIQSQNKHKLLSENFTGLNRGVLHQLIMLL